MSQMPPFAKEKFLSGVKAALVQNKLQAVTKVEFTEATTGAVMETLKVDASR
jgi:hypothetical protein